MRSIFRLGVVVLTLPIVPVAYAELLPVKPLCAAKTVTTNVGATAEQAPNSWLPTCDAAKISTPNGVAATSGQLGGLVLFAGGNVSGTPLTNAQVFVPSLVSFFGSKPMRFARQSHTLTRLADGRILVAGGGSRIAEIWSSVVAVNVDPFGGNRGANLGSFVMTGTMALDRAGHTGTLLPTGKVLLAGGRTCGAFGGVGLACTTASAELFDPEFDTFSPAGTMMARLTSHTANLLPDGKVLIAGGTIGGTPTDIAQLYNPIGGQFSYLGTMTVPRRGHVSVALTDGRILIAGGDLAHSIEIYNPVTKKFAATGRTLSADPRHVGLLANGKVLFAWPGTGPAKLFDPITRVLSNAGPYSGGSSLQASTVGARLNDGRFLLLNGGAGVGQLYQP
jgi:hypothetical protein